MKNLFIFSGKLFLVFFATSVVALISMIMCLSSDMGLAYKIIVGLLFVAFTLVLAWNNALNRGEADTKEHNFFYWKGFAAGAVAMLPAILVTVYYLIISYHGWETGIRETADGVYTLLYLAFISYSPLLATLVPFNPAFSIDFAQPAITVLKNITMPNAVFAPMFFIPITIFIVAVGLGYIYGNKERKAVNQALKNAKNNK